MSVTKFGSRAVSLKSFAFLEAIRPAQCWSLGCHSPARSGRLQARTCWRMTSGWKSGLDSSAICLAAGYDATGKNQAFSCLEPSRAGLRHALDRTANRPRSQRPRGREGARRSNTQAHSAPLRTGTVRGPEHRTSNVEHPTSNLERRGKATQSHTLVKVESRKQKVEIGAKDYPKPPKATTKPYSRHILGIDSGVQSHPKATLKPPQSATKATPKPHQSHTKATPKPHQGYPKATPRLHQSHTKATPKPHQGYPKATFGGGHHCRDGGGNLDTYPVRRTC